MIGPHNPGQLTAYALGLLGDEDAQLMASHLAGCAQCRRELGELREVDAALRELPPELFFAGPVQKHSPGLQGALRQAREERDAGSARRHWGRRHWGRRRPALVAAAVVLLLGVGTAGIAVGWVSANQEIAAEPTAGTRVLAGFNHATGARMTVTITPARGWVQVKATVAGIPVGEHCQIVVLDRSGHPSIAGSWVFSPTEEEQEYGVTGAAAVAPADVSAVKLQTFAGRELVSVPM